MDKDGVNYRVLPLSHLSSVTNAPVDVNPVQARGKLVDQVSVFPSIVNFLKFSNGRGTSGSDGTMEVYSGAN